MYQTKLKILAVRAISLALFSMMRICLGLAAMAEKQQSSPQQYSQRGFVETGATIYPQEAPGDSSKVVVDSRIRYEGFYRFDSNLQLAGGMDFRTDTHHQTERQWRFDWEDRGSLRPLASLRRLSAQYHKGGLTVEAGKQFVRWGRADILNPTDRFAPRDYLTVVDNEFLGIEAVRGTYEHGANTLDLVWSPWFTPSRAPLINQRWTIVPPGTPSFTLERDFPKGSQTGFRWSHVGFVEYSAAYFSGFGHDPTYGLVPGQFAIRRIQAEQRMIGGDAALPLRWISVKGEVAYTRSLDNLDDNGVLYVLQVERQAGEWFFVGGYAGDKGNSPGL